MAKNDVTREELEAEVGNLRAQVREMSEVIRVYRIKNGGKVRGKRKRYLLTASPSLAIASVNGVSDPATIGDAFPWTVSGQVGFDPGTGATMITAMAYQINDGPVNSFSFPTGNPATYSFPLTSDDIPANGTYVLTVYAWDDSGASNVQSFTIQAVNIAANPIITLGGC